MYFLTAHAEMACDPTRTADVAAVVMHEGDVVYRMRVCVVYVRVWNHLPDPLPPLVGLAHVCVVTSSMTLTRARIEIAIPRKRKGSVSNHEKVCDVWVVCLWFVCMWGCLHACVCAAASTIYRMHSYRPFSTIYRMHSYRPFRNSTSWSCRQSFVMSDLMASLAICVKRRRWGERRMGNGKGDREMGEIGADGRRVQRGLEVL